MKKILLLLVLVLASVLILAGCGCEHIWVDADCVTPKTCSQCQATEGAPLGHSWLAATCDAPKSCENCDATEGEAKGHIWEEATCTVPKKCSVCYATEGGVLNHDWEDATTETPKTCKNCGLSEGDRIVTDVRFTTASTKHLQGKWGCDVVITGDMLGTTGYLDEIPCTVIYEFCNDGTMICTVDIHDRLAFMEGMKKLYTDLTYESLAAMGYGKAAADEAIKQETGMTMEEYISATVDSVDLDDVFGAMTEDGVYYVGENMIYNAASWYNEFDGSNYTLEDGVLIIEDVTMTEDSEPLEFTRIEEE